MRRLIASLFLLAATAAAHAQEIPGLRVTLQARSLVPANATVQLQMTLQATVDTEVPAQLVNGHRLRVTCDELPPQKVEQAGKGGAVMLAAGTKIERQLSFPVAGWLPADQLDRIHRVFVAWDDMAGVGCDFKVAPDTSKLAVAQLDLTKTQVVLVTSAGDMTLSFRPDKAPNHVENFVKLCLQGFYDGMRFHRVIKGFMIQSGCPNTKDEDKQAQWGQGGPGYTINDERSDLKHLRGTLSMARTNQPNTGGSGFFIVHKDSPQLDGQYSAFGNLELGADVLDRIANGLVLGDRPTQPVVLYSAIVMAVKK
jgi:peptidyl-prolyl cis-trans isomerase B (cyclophilin B)